MSPRHDDFELGHEIGGLRTDIKHLSQCIEGLTDHFTELKDSTVRKEDCREIHDDLLAKLDLKQPLAPPCAIAPMGKKPVLHRVKENIVALSLLLAALVAIGGLVIRGAHFIVRAEAALAKVKSSVSGTREEVHDVSNHQIPRLRQPK
jgi:hypothetical protein